MLRTRKVRLVEPMSRPGRPYNDYITRWPLLGPITLATILHEQGYDVGVYNENVSGPLPENPQAYADVCDADVVGISIMTATAARGYLLADSINRDSPDTTLVFGGVHASFVPEEAAAHADVIVRGEGETVIEPIARGEIRCGIVCAEPPADLDIVPTPNHFLMRDFDRLVGPRERRHLYELPVMTSRGCPHGCTYCSVTRMFGRRVRRRSVEKVHEDIRRYHAQGFRHLFFYDDNFTTDRDWTRRLLERIRPMRVRFDAQARVDLHWRDAARRQLDRPLLDALRRSGGSLLYVGYETVDDATAEAWHKGYRGRRPLRERLREDTRILHDCGFHIHGMFVMGPQHTPRTAEQILDFARDGEIETIQISILAPFPGTPLFDAMRPHLLFRDFPADWDYYDGTHCVYGHTRMGIETFQKVVLDAHRRFYRSGRWLAKSLRDLMQEKMSPREKIDHLWQRWKTAQRTLREWTREMESFLELVRVRVHSDLTQVRQ